MHDQDPALAALPVLIAAREEQVGQTRRLQLQHHALLGIQITVTTITSLSGTSITATTSSASPAAKRCIVIFQLPRALSAGPSTMRPRIRQRSTSSSVTPRST